MEEGWARGFRKFKAIIGLNSPEVDARRVGELVGIMHGKGRLAVDIAQRWGTTEALEGCMKLDGQGLMWIEDPLHQDDCAGMRDLVRRIGTPICTGENAYGLRGAARIIEEVGCAYLMLDLERCGGITGWRKAAAIAESRNIRMTTHVYPHIGIQLVCGTASTTIGEYLPWWDDLLGEPITVRDGYAVPGEEPVVGATIDSSQLARVVWHTTVDSATR